MLLYLSLGAYVDALLLTIYFEVKLPYQEEYIYSNLVKISKVLSRIAVPTYISNKRI